MELNFTTNKRGERILQINDAQIKYCNFAGAESRYNRAGERNFALIVPNEDIKDALLDDVNEFGAAWNVKIKQREEGEDPDMYMNIKVKFTSFGPNIYLKSGNAAPVRLNEESVACLDNMDIASVDLDIRAYDDTINGRGFRSAYLQSIYVVQDFSRDRFASRFE